MRRRGFLVGGLVALTLAVLASVVWFSESVQDALMDRVIGGRVAQRRYLHDPSALHVVFCGTGTPLPDRRRGPPCIAVYAGEELLLVDAGDGAASRLAMMRAPVGQLGTVLLTHFHSDHIGGLGDVVLQSWASGRREPLEVYGPPGVESVTAGFEGAFALDSGYRTAHHGAEWMPPAGGRMTPHVVQVAGPDDVVTVFERGELRVRAFAVDHSPVDPAYGYRVDYRGRSVIFSGDTIQQDILARVGEGADVMVHEALAPHMMLAVADQLEQVGDRQRAQLIRDTLSYHATPVQAAETANAAGVRLLVYSHIVPSPPNLVAERVFLRGVPEVRGSGLVLGFDGLHLELPVGSTDIRQHELD